MPKKDDLPAMPFYWGEWFKSLDVQALPRDIRCVWFEMLGRMWDSSERGYLTINGKPMEAPAKALALGFGENVQTYLDYEKKLEDYGIFSRRESDGAIYSRFILKLVEMRKKKQESGSKGGRKTQAGAKAGANESALAKRENETESTIVQEKEIFKNVPIPKVLDNPDCIKALNYFFEYRVEVHNKPIQAIPQIELFLKKLKDLCYGDSQKAVKILNDSMIVGYPDIYEIKTGTGKKEEVKPTVKKKWGIKECPHCHKIDEYRIISESTKGIIALCQNKNCNKEFEVKNE